MSTNKQLKPSTICTCINLRRASQTITQFYDDLLRPSGLKVTQYSLLRHLQYFGALSMSELSQATRLERTTLIRNLKVLEKMGLICITTAQAPQANQVCITVSGSEALETARPYWEQAQERTKDLFTADEFLVLRGALRKIESLGS